MAQTQAPGFGSPLAAAHDAWGVGARFALGAAIGLGGAIASIWILSKVLGPNVGGSGADVTVAPALALSGRARLMVMAAAAAVCFFIGGFTAGGSLRDRLRDTRKDRVAFGFAFLVAGLLLTLLLLGLWIGRAAPWYAFALQGICGAVIWILAGTLAAIISRDNSGRVRDVLAGFGLGGLAGGASFTLGLLVLSASGGPGAIARVIYLTSVLLLCILPPAIAGAMLARARGLQGARPSSLSAFDP